MNRNKYKSLNRFKKLLLLAGILVSSSGLFAQAPVPDAMEDPFVVVMVIIMVILALIIGLLAWVVLGSAQLYLQKWKQEEDEEKKKSNPAATVTTVIALLLLSMVTKADEGGSAAVTATAHQLSDTTFYTMTGVIFLELIVIGALLYNLRVLLEIRRKKAAVAAATKPRVALWNKMNKFKPVEEEQSIDLGHEYDGIRELDNRLPPWWLYGFYCTIIFAVIYLWRFHVSHTAPSTVEEYQMAVKEADIKRAEYLKKAANNVDENTVKLLTTSNDQAAGQKVFESLCAACHGKQGEGGVGPNLTDEYWLHGGSINDVFKTIKYGVPDKGMKSWKDDYSPGQIAQIASYIKSLKGTNPPNGKAPQGNVYKEEQAATHQQ